MITIAQKQYSLSIVFIWLTQQRIILHDSGNMLCLRKQDVDMHRVCQYCYLTKSFTHIWLKWAMPIILETPYSMSSVSLECLFMYCTYCSGCFYTRDVPKWWEMGMYTNQHNEFHFNFARKCQQVLSMFFSNVPCIVVHNVVHPVVE